MNLENVLLLMVLEDFIEFSYFKEIEDDIFE